MIFQVCLSRTVRAQGGLNSLELWQTERPREMANIADLQVMCGKQHMEVEVTFDKPFNGIIFSKVRNILMLTSGSLLQFTERKVN